MENSEDSIATLLVDFLSVLAWMMSIFVLTLVIGGIISFILEGIFFTLLVLIMAVVAGGIAGIIRVVQLSIINRRKPYEQLEVEPTDLNDNDAESSNVLRDQKDENKELLDEHESELEDKFREKIKKLDVKGGVYSITEGRILKACRSLFVAGRTVEEERKKMIEKIDHKKASNRFPLALEEFEPLPNEKVVDILIENKHIIFPPEDDKEDEMKSNRVITNTTKRRHHSHSRQRLPLHTDSNFPPAPPSTPQPTTSLPSKLKKKVSFDLSINNNNDDNKLPSSLDTANPQGRASTPMPAMGSKKGNSSLSSTFIRRFHTQHDLSLLGEGGLEKLQEEYTSSQEEYENSGNSNTDSLDVDEEVGGDDDNNTDDSFPDTPTLK